MWPPKGWKFRFTACCSFPWVWFAMTLTFTAVTQLLREQHRWQWRPSQSQDSKTNSVAVLLLTETIFIWRSNHFYSQHDRRHLKAAKWSFISNRISYSGLIYLILNYFSVKFHIEVINSNKCEKGSKAPGCTNQQASRHISHQPR